MSETKKVKYSDLTEKEQDASEPVYDTLRFLKKYPKDNFRCYQLAVEDVAKMYEDLDVSNASALIPELKEINDEVDRIKPEILKKHDAGISCLRLGLNLKEVQQCYKSNE